MAPEHEPVSFSIEKVPDKPAQDWLSLIDYVLADGRYKSMVYVGIEYNQRGGIKRGTFALPPGNNGHPNIIELTPEDQQVMQQARGAYEDGDLPTTQEILNKAQVESNGHGGIFALGEALVQIALLETDQPLSADRCHEILREPFLKLGIKHSVRTPGELGIPEPEN